MWSLARYRKLFFRDLLLHCGADRRNGAGKVQLPHYWARSASELMGFPRWLRYLPPLCPNQSKAKGFNRAIHSIPDATDKTRRLLFMIRRSTHKCPISALIPSYRELMYPHLECGMPPCCPNLWADTNPLERIQRLASRLVIHFHCVPYEERLDQHSFQWQLQDIQGGYWMWNPVCYTFPTVVNDHPHKVPAIEEREGYLIFKKL